MRQEALQTAYIGIGANLGDPHAAVRHAIAALAQLPATRLVKQSSLYKTAPVGYREQPDFINAVAQVQTGLEPEALLEHLLAIETRFGRTRSVRNAPRTLDLDLLLYGDRSFQSPRRTLPHPRMKERAFVLVPLAEIAPHACVGAWGEAAQLRDAVSTEGVSRIGPAGAGVATVGGENV